MDGHNGMCPAWSLRLRTSQTWLQQQVWVRTQNVAWREVTLGLENACEGIAGGDTHRGYLGALAVSTKDLPL